MTTDNWLAIGGIVATLLAPTLQVLLEIRLKRKARNKAKGQVSTPAIRQTKTPGEKLLVWALFLVPSAVLLTQVLSIEPLSRVAVFSISLSVSSLFFMVMVSYVDRILNILEHITGTLMFNTTLPRRPTKPPTGRVKTARR